MADRPSPELAAQPPLRRSLGLFSLTVYGLGNMLGAGIYALVGKAAGEMGNAVWLAFATSMVAAGLTGLSYASLGSRYPRAAGAAYISHRAFGLAMLSYVVGLAVMMSGLTSMATASQAFARFASELQGVLPIPVVVAVFLVALTAVNIAGIRESAWLNALCTLVEAGGLILVIAVGVRYWGSVDYLDATSVKNTAGDLSLPLILTGAVLTFFSFIGFEDLLNVSEEVKNPRRTFPIALILALVLATVIYMAVSITAVSVVPHDQLAAEKTPLMKVVAVAAPWFPSALFVAVSMFAVANTALLNSIMGSRLAYGMARQGLLPAFLGRVHPTRRTPHVAILILMGIVLALALVGEIAALASATSLLLLGSFTVVNLALVRLKLKPGEPRGGFEVPIVVPILGALVSVAFIVNRVIEGARLRDVDGVMRRDLMPIYIAFGIVAAIAVLYLILRPKAVAEEVEPQMDADQRG